MKLLAQFLNKRLVLDRDVVVDEGKVLPVSLASIL